MMIANGKKFALALLASLLLSGSASASEALAEFSPAELLAATQSSLAAFQAANPDHVVHLSGFKTWKSGADAKVKIYVNHDGMAMEYNYNCALSGGQVKCVVAQ